MFFYVVAFFVGGFFGVLVMALCVAARESAHEIEESNHAFDITFHRG